MKILNNWVCDRSGKLYEPSEKTHGFVYRVVDKENGKFYIGKKQVYKEIALGKRETQALIDAGDYDKRKKNKKRVFTDWKTYKTSNKTLKKRIDDAGVHKNELFDFIVLYECYDETSLKFMELKNIILFGAFEGDNGYNDNIQIKQIGAIKGIADRRLKV